MPLDEYFKKLDARYRIPRPANALHLDAYQAGFRVLRDAGEGAALIASGIATSFILWKIFAWRRPSPGKTHPQI